MFCPKCGYENDDTSTFCNKCGARIPHFEQAEAAVKEHTPINGRLRNIENAVESVKSGSLSLDGFISYMQDLHSTLLNKEKEIREIVIPEEASVDFQEELNVGFSGIGLYNQGIGLMLSYDGGEDTSVLDEGLEYVRQGNECINEAMRINLASRSRLEEEISRNAGDTILEA